MHASTHTHAARPACPGQCALGGFPLCGENLRSSPSAPSLSTAPSGRSPDKPLRTGPSTARRPSPGALALTTTGVQVRPGIYVTYNGDNFDWPFIEARARHHGLSVFDSLGFRAAHSGEFVSKNAVHMDCLCWVNRDSYLPQGSRGLKVCSPLRRAGEQCPQTTSHPVSRSYFSSAINWVISCDIAMYVTTGRRAGCNVSTWRICKDGATNMRTDAGCMRLLRMLPWPRPNS